MITSKRSRIFIGGLLLLTGTLLPLRPAHADPPDCSAGKVLNIVAHPDDDLLFINPKIQQDIDAGKCVETIFVTAGASLGGTGRMGKREAGIGAAYAQMAGQPSVGAAQSITINGKPAAYYTFANKPEVSMVFLRLQELNHLRPLWQGTDSDIEAVNSTSNDPITFSKQELIDTLHARMADYNPDTIRTLNFAREIDPNGTEDHWDHTVTAYFAQAAHYNYTEPHQFYGYVGYEGNSMAENVSGATLTAKQNAYFAYEVASDNPEDPDDHPCKSLPTCEKPSFLEHMERNYEMGSQPRGNRAFETMEGDSGSLSQVTGDIGKQPVSITYNGDIYAFYYDATSQDLRVAKATSSTNPQWTFGTIDSTGNVGHNASAVVYNNQLHVFYYRSDTGDLRHATLSNGVWSAQTRDSGGDVGESSTVVTYGTSLQLFYYDKTNGNLKHAWLYNGNWSYEALDGHSTAGGRVNADLGADPQAVIYDGHLQLFYYDKTNGNLRHVWENAGWHFENLDGDTTTGGRYNANVGQKPSVAVYGTSLQTVYYDATNGNLRHAWSDATGWHFENLEGDVGSVTRYTGTTGLSSSVVVQGNDLHVFSYDANGSLRHVWTTPTMGWQAERMDGRGDDVAVLGRINGPVGEDPSAIVYGTSLHVFYYEAASTNFRHATL